MEKELKVLNEVKTSEEISALNIKTSRKPLELKGLVSDLSKTSDSNTKKVHDTLMEFSKIVNDIHPNNNKKYFRNGLISKVLGINQIQKYVDKYQSYNDLINKISGNLTEGKNALKNDVITLTKVLSDLQNEYSNLQNDLYKLQDIKTDIEKKMEESDKEEKQRLEAGVYTKALQKEADIKEKLILAQQGAISIGILITNNEKLCESVERCLDVTVSALELTVLQTSSLEQQKKVIDVVNGLNEQTSSMIIHMADTMQTQAAEINKQASSAMLDPRKLAEAYDKINDTLEQMVKLRIENAGNLKKVMAELDNVVEKAEKRAQEIIFFDKDIKRLGEGRSDI